jgi:hypothetical protein
VSLVAEDNPMNDYPDEISEDEEGSECESEESERSGSSNELSDEDVDDEIRRFAKGLTSDPLYDEDFDDFEGRGVGYDNDEDGDEDVGSEH